MDQIVPVPGNIVQVSIDCNIKKLWSVLLIVKEVDFEKDEVIAACIIPDDRGSTAKWFRVPLEECEVVGRAIWAPEDIKGPQ